MSQAATEIVRISGHAGAVPGAGLNREFQVCKLVDTTTCIGCKACEVACLEWNGYTFSETRSTTATRPCRKRPGITGT
jgi:formate dehydrogenase iron-sulfur subunit